jgi:uncharacterized membrane protein YdbT with pleckstrin-like domain
MIEVDPRTARHLISDQGEVVIDEVRKHWAALTGPVLELFGGLIVILFIGAVPKYWPVPLLLGLAVWVHAAWRILDRRRDRFVITNMRVFRIHGILSEQIATMPLSRILDISVHKPFVGRIFGYGHFIFESAAQAQGLREIRYVGSPNERGLTIQRVIQQAGLRGYAGQQPEAVLRTPGHDTERVERPPLPPLPPLRPLPGDRYDPDRTTTDPLDIPR